MKHDLDSESYLFAVNGLKRLLDALDCYNDLVESPKIDVDKLEDIKSKYRERLRNLNRYPGPPYTFEIWDSATSNMKSITGITPEAMDLLRKVRGVAIWGSEDTTIII